MAPPAGVFIVSDSTRNRNYTDMCEDFPIPSARQLFQGATLVPNIVMCVVGCLLFAATLAVYLECVVFIYRHFRLKDRQIRTTWVLAVYPIFSFCSLIAVLIPRSSTITDLVMDVFLSSCLYQFLLLLMGYLGNEDVAWETVKDTQVHIDTPPVCCCCVCLPTVTLTRKFLHIMKLMVMQVTIMRPILSFIVAVMWADGTYTPGYISPDNAYIFITIINLCSSSTAVWGLTLMRSAFLPILKPFQPAGKFMALQFVILLTIVPGLVINVLVNRNVIPCIEMLPSKARGDRIYHGFLVCAMLPLLLIARLFYRRKWEGGFGSKVMDTQNVNNNKSDCTCAHNDSKCPTHHNVLLNDNTVFSSAGSVKIKEYTVDNKVHWITYL